MQKETNKWVGAVLLIAGTSTGAAMLALPVSTATYGFFPSLFLCVICWLCMTMTGILLLEVNLWLKPGANIVSMAHQTLGVGGQVFAWVAYFLLFYSLMAAYVSGMGDVIRQFAESYFQVHISTGTGALFLVVLVGSVVYIGMKWVDYLNRIFFFGKLLTYAAVVLAVSPFIHFPQLQYVDFSKSWLALPVIITSFGFQNTIPGLRMYLQDDVPKLRSAILVGSSIPLVVYILWELVIMGVVPREGDQGLLSILALGQPATGLALSLQGILQNPWISSLFNAFVFCAIITSFTGVSFSLFDFLIDSFKLNRDRKGRTVALVCTFLPPIIFAFLYPNGFMVALGYGGAIVALLLGLLPVLMCWSGRYWKKIAVGYRPKINRFILSLIALFMGGIAISQLWI